MLHVEHFPKLRAIRGAILQARDRGLIARIGRRAPRGAFPPTCTRIPIYAQQSALCSETKRNILAALIPANYLEFLKAELVLHAEHKTTYVSYGALVKISLSDKCSTWSICSRRASRLLAGSGCFLIFWGCDPWDA